MLVLVGTIAAAPLMKTNFLGDSGQNTFTMTQELGPRPSLDDRRTRRRRRGREALSKASRASRRVQVSIGSSGSALRDAFSGGGSGITYSITTDTDADQEAARRRAETRSPISTTSAHPVAASGGGFGSSDIEIDVTAPDRGRPCRRRRMRSSTALDGPRASARSSSNLSASLPYIAVAVDRDAAAQRGLSEVAVGALVSNTMQPQRLGSVEIDETSLTVYIAAAQTPATPSTSCGLSASRPPPASCDSTRSPRSPRAGPDLDHHGARPADRDRHGDPVERRPAAASASVNAALDEAELPASADAEVGGVVTAAGGAFSQLGLALLAAILIVYIVMVATFKSLRQPLLLLVSVPFAATGAILLQIVTGMPLGVASLIGVLMLIGIVVTNAIVLVDLVNQYREKGLSTARRDRSPGAHGDFARS